MRFDEIASMLNGILGTNKCAYYQWPEEKAPNLPYILFIIHLVMMSAQITQIMQALQT